MISLTPNSTPVDISHAMQILTLVSNPDACKERLTELQEVVDRANAASERAISLQSDATQRMSVYEAGATNLAADKAAFANLTKEVGDRQSATDAALVARKVELDTREANLTTSMTAREKAVSQREVDVAGREATAIAAGGQVDAMKAEYETKLAKLRDIMGEK